MNGPEKGKFKVVMDHDLLEHDAVKIFGGKNDHKILNAALGLQKSEDGARVILVSKDINLRLKAKALNIEAEDFETGKIDCSLYWKKNHRRN